MIQVTVFSGHEGRLRYGKQFYLTIFGGCELVRPTVANRMLVQSEQGRGGRPLEQTPFFLTIFGAAEIKCPTLAEEFMDLRELLNTEGTRFANWETAITAVSRGDGALASFTLFGGFDECALPSENEEVDSLALHRHLGNISDSAGQILQCGVGQRDVERYATVRQAVLNDVSQAA